MTFTTVSKSMKTEMQEQSILGLWTWAEGSKDMQIKESDRIDQGGWGPQNFKAFPIANVKCIHTLIK